MLSIFSTHLICSGREAEARHDPSCDPGQRGADDCRPHRELRGQVALLAFTQTGQLIFSLCLPEGKKEDDWEIASK